MFIGPKEIKTTEKTEETTPSGSPVIKVTYHDGAVERIASAMYEKIATEEKCSLEELRSKRCQPVVAVLLLVLNEWGVKLGELGYISALLNQSLEFNKDAALRELWSQWMPKPITPDDVDLLTVDRVLKGIPKVAKDYGTDDGSK